MEYLQEKTIPKRPCDRLPEIAGNQACLDMQSSVVIQMLRVYIPLEQDGGEYHLKQLHFSGGRDDTGYRDSQKKKIQGNHTISDKALQLYQEIMMKDQTVSYALAFYHNMAQELDAEKTVLRQKGLLDNEGERGNAFDQVMLAFISHYAAASKKSTEKAGDTLAERRQYEKDLRILLQDMVEAYNELYALSAFSTDGLEKTGGHGELLGTNYMKALGKKHPLDDFVNMLLLAPLVDILALNSIVPEGYTFSELEAVTSTVMGLPFNLNRFREFGQFLTVEGQSATESYNPLLIRFFAMVANILAKKRGNEFGYNRPHFYFAVEKKPQGKKGVPHENPFQNFTAEQAQSNHMQDMVKILRENTDTPDLSTTPWEYVSDKIPMGAANQKEIDITISNLAVKAAITLADSVRTYLPYNKSTWKNTSAQVNYYMQSILLCNKSKLKQATEVRRRLTELDLIVVNQSEDPREKLKGLYTAILDMVVICEFLGYVPGSELPIA